MRFRTFRWFLALLTSVALLGGCTTNPYTGQPQLSKTAAGAAIGAATGAAIGAVTGGDRGKRAAIGAAAGAVAGGAVGAYMDVQESKLRERLAGTGVGVDRIGNEILLRMPGNVTFETDRSDIRPQFYDVLGSVGVVLQEYDRTRVEVAGFTDSSGSDGYNQTLSERRATSVAVYLSSQGVVQQRIVARGFGERYPIADNATPSGREQNRRVELKLIPVEA